MNVRNNDIKSQIIVDNFPAFPLKSSINILNGKVKKYQNNVIV
jgi:hypothetical protein